MDNTAKILEQGFSCLVDNMGVIDAEHFISLIKRDDFDYTIWQREYFDKMESGEFAAKASVYASNLQYGEKYSCRLTPAIMQYNEIMVHEDEEGEGVDDSGSVARRIRFGIELFSSYEMRFSVMLNDDRLLERLKALGDSTRLKIMHNLVESPSYLQELAKKLKLTPATVLHHLGILMSEGLIEIQMTGEKKRVYYQVNKQGLQEVSNGIMQLAMTRQERETQKREQQMKDIQKNQGDGQWTI